MWDGIKIKVSVDNIDLKNGGWVGLGWGTTGAMDKSDFAVCTYKDESFSMKDYKDNGSGTHTLTEDSSKDL